jgi:hypothetical protein
VNCGAPPSGPNCLVTIVSKCHRSTGGIGTDTSVYYKMCDGVPIVTVRRADNRMFIDHDAVGD